MRALTWKSCAGACLAALLMVLPAVPAAAQGPELFTSPIDITGGRIAIEAVALDRDTGAQRQVPIPGFGPGLTALTERPVNLVFDAMWNGKPEQQAAGTTPRQQACDGPGGIKATIADKVAGMGRRAYDLTCTMAASGSVFVRQVPGGIYVSYQLFGNSGGFRVTDPRTCHPDHGTFLCPNDARFSLKFAMEVTTLIRTPGSICSLSAEPAQVLLHAVQITPENAAASLHDLLNPSQLTGMELAAQARERTTSISVNDAFAELRIACGRGDAIARLIGKFTGLETEVRLPQGVTFRAIHPGIPAPRFQNVDLPSGNSTCVAGYVWREAYDGDVVCVTPERRSEIRAENGTAAARRDPNGGPWGDATCLSGFVWRLAKPDDLTCVTEDSRTRVAEENSTADSRWVLGAPVPSFTRPSITAPPIIDAGASFEVGGQFFPAVPDPSRLQLAITRDATAVCQGGGTELERSVAGGPAQVERLPASGNMGACAYSYQLTGLQPATRYRFRVRDCDPITCGPWSAPFETTTLSANSGPGPVTIRLDTGVVLGSVATDAAGGFTTTVAMPADTPPGPHDLSAFSGERGDTIGVRVMAAGGGVGGTLMVTGTFFGDVGCPMREINPPQIAARYEFSLFGTGFAPGASVTIYLDQNGGRNLGTIAVAGDGTFCGMFAAVPVNLSGGHDLIAVQGGAVRATLPVEVVYVREPG